MARSSSPRTFMPLVELPGGQPLARRRPRAAPGVTTWRVTSAGDGGRAAATSADADDDERPLHEVERLLLAGRAGTR